MRQDYTLNSMVRHSHWFCSADEESHGLSFLVKCHYKDCWMSCVASGVLWLGSSVEFRLKAVLRNAQGYELLLCPSRLGEPVSKGGKFPCDLDSSHPASQVPWPNGAGFALQTISSACHSLLECCWKMQLPGGLVSLSGQVGARSYTQQCQAVNSPPPPG